MTLTMKRWTWTPTPTPTRSLRIAAMVITMMAEVVIPTPTLGHMEPFLPSSGVNNTDGKTVPLLDMDILTLYRIITTKRAMLPVSLSTASHSLMLIVVCRPERTGLSVSRSRLSAARSTRDKVFASLVWPSRVGHGRNGSSSSEHTNVYDVWDCRLFAKG
jgi:hypothetical protein